MGYIKLHAIEFHIKDQLTRVGALEELSRYAYGRGCSSGYRKQGTSLQLQSRPHGRVVS